MKLEVVFCLYFLTFFYHFFLLKDVALCNPSKQITLHSNCTTQRPPIFSLKCIFLFQKKKTKNNLKENFQIKSSCVL